MALRHLASLLICGLVLFGTRAESSPSSDRYIGLTEFAHTQTLGNFERGGLSANHHSIPLKEQLPKSEFALTANRIAFAKLRLRHLSTKKQRTSLPVATKVAGPSLLDAPVEFLYSYFKLFSVLGVFLIGCTSNRVFDSYLDTFAREAGHYGVKYRETQLEFGHPRPSKLSLNNLAECKPGNSLYPPKVIVDKTQWDKLSSVAKEALIFHEMGHCALQRQHGQGVMQPELIAENTYKSYRTSLLQKLFRGVKHRPEFTPQISGPVSLP